MRKAHGQFLKIDVSALYLIAAPRTPEPVRAAAMSRAENGEAARARQRSKRDS
jgi:hypothetical protein